MPRRRMLARLLVSGFVGLAGIFALGCEPARRVDLEQLPAEKAEMVGYYLPSQIEILPFTKVDSFDEDAIPDGITAVIRPTDVLGDPVKAYGTVRFELYEHLEASGLNKGKRLTVWQHVLASPAQQSRYWDRVTQTYQFQLAWQQPLKPNTKYVLEVVYENPAGVRLFDDFVFEFAPKIEQIKQELRRTGP